MAGLCLATSYTPDFADIGAFAAASLHLYGARHGHPVHAECLPAGERPPAWRKIELLRSLLDRGHEAVLWVDADAVILRTDADIAAELRPGKDLYLVQHRTPQFPGQEVPNTGVMLVRDSEWTRGLLTRIWNREEYLHHPWWENAALIAVMGYGSLLGDAPHAPDPAVMARIGFLDEAWNAIPGISRCENPIICHYAGHPRDVRRAEMPRHAASIFSATTGKHHAERLACLERELAAICGSTSWRLTAPLRAIAERYRRMMTRFRG